MFLLFIDRSQEFTSNCGFLSFLFFLAKSSKYINVFREHVPSIDQLLRGQVDGEGLGQWEICNNYFKLTSVRRGQQTT